MSNEIPTVLLSALQHELSREPAGYGQAGDLPVAWASTRGCVREQNEDRVAIARCKGGLFVALVADGMGGMKDGGRAAALASSAVLTYCIAAPSRPIELLLKEALLYADREVYQLLRGSGGAALSVAAKRGKDICIAHAGDARAYALTDGKLHQLTVDDTVQGQLAKLHEVNDDSVGISSHLIQFIGVGSELEPHVVKLDSAPDGVVLTSDGAHMLPEEVMDWISSTASTTQQLAHRLVIASEWNGGLDNASAVAVDSSIRKLGAANEPTAECWLPDKFMALSSEFGGPGSPEWLSFERDLPQTEPRRQQPRPKKGRERKRTPRPPQQKQVPFVEVEQPTEASNGTRRATDSTGASKSALAPEEGRGSKGTSAESTPDEQAETLRTIVPPDSPDETADSQISSPKEEDK